MPKATKTAVEPVQNGERWEIVASKGGFTLLRLGNDGRIEDAGGKALSNPMPYDRAVRAFDRFSTSKR